MPLIRWVDAYFAFQAVQKTLSTLQSVKEKQQACYDPTTQTFSPITWTQWSAPSKDNLVQGLDATIDRVYELYDYFQQNYVDLRGWPQHKLSEERATLHEKAGLCLKFGLKHLTETYRTEDGRIQLQFDRLRRILKQPEKPATPQEPRIEDLPEFVEDLKANTQKLDPRFTHLLREEAKTWIEKTDLFTKRIEVKHPEHLRLFLDFFLEWQLEEFDYRIDRLCALNRSGFQEGRKELNAEIAAILADFTKAETHYRDLIDPEMLQEFTTCRLIGKVAQTMTATSRKSQKAACEIAGQCDEILQGLIDSRVGEARQMAEEEQTALSNLGLIVSEKLITGCIADQIRKPHLNFEVVITAYNHWQLYSKHFGYFNWESHAVQLTGEIKEGEVKCPARFNDRFGLYHFWSLGQFSLSSSPTSKEEMDSLHRYLDSKRGDPPKRPFVLHLDHTWSDAKKIHTLIQDSALNSCPFLNIPLVPSQFWDESKKLNIRGLAQILHQALPLVKDTDFDGLDNPQNVFQELERQITTPAATLEQTNLNIERQLLSILNAYKKEIAPDTPNYQLGHVSLLTLKTLFFENTNPLMQTELLLLIPTFQGAPIHLMDPNGLDRSGIGCALWEALLQMKEKEKCSALQIFEMLKFLSTDRGAGLLWRCCVDASLNYEKKNQKKPVQSLDQSYDNATSPPDISFAQCLSDQIHEQDQDSRIQLLRAASYCSFYTESLIKTGGVMQLLGTGVVGLKLNHDSDSVLNSIGMAYTNPWAEKRLLPFIETEKGNLIQLFNPIKGGYTPAGMDIIHRLSQRREKDFKYSFES